MKWFSSNQVTDERIVHMKNQIYKEVYVLIMSICTISMAVKSFIFNDWKAALLEFVIVLSGGLYFGIRSVFSGLYSDETEVHDRRSRISLTKKTLLSGIGIGVALGLFIGVRNAILYGDGSWSTGLWYFFLVSLVTMLFCIPILASLNGIVHQLANKASQSMSKKDHKDD